MSNRPTDSLSTGFETLIGSSALKTAAEPGALLWGMSGCAKALGISRSTLERERSGGRFPPPDRMIGRRPLWRPTTVERYIDGTYAGEVRR